MKIMKKAMAMVLSMVMMLAMCATAFADEPTTFKITAPETNHQYEIYQIFTGDYSDGKLTNEVWGENGTGKKGTDVEDTVLNELKDIDANASDTAKLEVITKYAKLDDSTPVATVTNGSSYDAKPGYYLIKDKEGTVTGKDSYTLYLVQVVGADVTIKPKSEVPSFEKKVKDTNDSTGNTSDWQDSADYDIGDQVPFQLKGTVASNYDAYKTYYFAFHDQEEKVKVTDSEGNEKELPVLKFNKDSVKVYVDGKEVTTGFVVTENPTDGDTFDIVFEDLKAIQDTDGSALVHANSEITVEYTSELTANANLGNQGNINKAKLEFSNNPNSNQAGKPDKPGETPWDNVIVFTYKVVVDKYANSTDGEKLAGADFKLEKVLADGSKQEISRKVTSDDGKTFTFSGLDEGKYILTETKTPDGYNTIKPIEFTVKADHTIEWNGENRTGVLTDLTGTATTGNITFTANTDKSELATKVVNKQGITLPSTGGMGTTLFYMIGGILVAGAAVVLIAKKRMEAEK